MKPLIYLELRQFVNSVKNTARSPKRLIPTLLIGAWIAAWFLQSLLFFTGHGSIDPAASLPISESLAEQRTLIETALFLVLSVGSVMVMYGAFSSGLMVFSVAQIDFMFPTPISRRKVLLVKLIRDYSKYVFWVVFVFMFVGSPMFRSVQASIFPWGIVSIAAVVALLVLVVNVAHTINVVFTFGYEKLRQARLLIKAALVVIPSSAAAYWLFLFAKSHDSLASLISAGNSPVMNGIFAPARWCAELCLAPLVGVTPDEWMHFWLLWALAGGSLALLLSRRENIYEPSLGISVKFAKRRRMASARSFADLRVEALREKGAKHVKGVAIPAFGLGATAFLWKNLLLRHRIHRSQIIYMLLAPLLIVCLIGRFVTEPSLARYVPGLMIYIVWILSMMAQTEMRNDLKYANTVKSMPIAAWKIMSAQIAGSVLYLAGGTALFSLYLWMLLPPARGEVLVACAVASPFIGFANISASTISGLLYPETRDFAQNYLCGMIGFLMSSIAMAPTVVLSLVTHFLLGWPMYLTVVLVCVANMIVGMAGVTISGAIFRRFDPTSE